jgi:acyl carrier protein
MRTRLEQLVREHAGEDAGPIRDESTFGDALGLDNLDMISLVLEVEDKLGVRLPDSAIEGLATFGALVKAVEAELVRDVATERARAAS